MMRSVGIGECHVVYDNRVRVFVFRQGPEAGGNQTHGSRGINTVLGGENETIEFVS